MLWLVALICHAFPIICAHAIKTIHFVDLGAGHGEGSIGSWEALNPEFTVKVWTESDIPVLMERSGHEASAVYNRLTMSEKHDFISYLAVYTYGGVYSDLEGQCLQRVRRWMTPETYAQTEFFAGLSSEVFPEEKHAMGVSRLREVSTKTFGGKPMNACLACVIESIIEKVNAMDSAASLPWTPFVSIELTGAGVLTDCVFNTGDFEYTNVLKSAWIASNGVLLYGVNAFAYSPSPSQRIKQLKGQQVFLFDHNHDLASRDADDLIDVAEEGVLVYQNKGEAFPKADLKFSRTRSVGSTSLEGTLASKDILNAFPKISNIERSDVVTFRADNLLPNILLYNAAWLLWNASHAPLNAALLPIFKIFRLCLPLAFIIPQSRSTESMCFAVVTCLGVLHRKYRTTFSAIAYKSKLHASSKGARGLSAALWILSHNGVLLFFLCALTITKTFITDVEQSISEQCDCQDCLFPLTIARSEEKKTNAPIFQGGSLGVDSAKYKYGNVLYTAKFTRDILLAFENTGSTVWRPDLDYRIALIGRSSAGIPTKLELPTQTLPGELAIVKVSADIEEDCLAGATYVDLN